MAFPVLTLTFRVVIGIVFIYASLEKIQYPADFAIAVQNFRIIPAFLTNLVAIILPWLELVSGLFLLAGLFIRENSGIISALILVFIFVMISALIRGFDINCGCYGMDSRLSWGRVLEDVGLLLMAVYVTMFPDSHISLDHIFARNNPSD